MKFEGKIELEVWSFKLTSTTFVVAERVSSGDGSHGNLHVDEEGETAVGQEDRDEDGPENTVQTDGQDGESSTLWFVFIVNSLV